MKNCLSGEQMRNLAALLAIDDEAPLLADSDSLVHPTRVEWPKLSRFRRQGDLITFARIAWCMGAWRALRP